jgi:hypothetical protein
VGRLDGVASPLLVRPVDYSSLKVLLILLVMDYFAALQLCNAEDRKQQCDSQSMRTVSGKLSFQHRTDGNPNLTSPRNQRSSTSDY